MIVRYFCCRGLYKIPLNSLLGYIRIDSLVEQNVMWKVRVDKQTTVEDVIKKMEQKLGPKYRSFELYEIQGSTSKYIAVHVGRCV